MTLLSLFPCSNSHGDEILARVKALPPNCCFHAVLSGPPLMSPGLMCRCDIITPGLSRLSCLSGPVLGLLHWRLLVSQCALSVLLRVCIQVLKRSLYGVPVSCVCFLLLLGFLCGFFGGGVGVCLKKK